MKRRNRTRNRRGNRSSNGNFKIAGLTVVLTSLMGGTLYGAYTLMDQPVADEFGCYEGERQPLHYMLVDVSEPRFSVEQSRSLKRKFDQVFEWLGFNEQFAVYTSAQKEMASIAAPSFKVCGPAKSSADLEAIGADGSTSAYIRKQSQRLYDKVLAPNMAALLDPNPPADRQQKFQSPILEMIGDLSRLPQFKYVQKLTIVSDGLQNGLGGNFCYEKNALPPFEAYAKRPVYERLKPEGLDGVAVEFLMLERPGYGQGSMRYCSEDELRDFWKDYFVANGAASVKIVRIRAGTEGG